MKNKLTLLALAVALGTGAQAHASSVTYLLNQSNVEAVLPDNNPYLTVTIEDGIAFNADTNAVKFTVNLVNSAFTPGSNFGIQEFGFNLAASAPTVTDSNIVGPIGWTGNIAPPNNQLDGFGRFAGSISTSGSNRLTSLEFHITGVTGDTIASYFAPSTGTAGQGNAFFAAHVAGFTTSDTTTTSGFFGGGSGSTPPVIVPNPPSVPLPGAVWMFGAGLMGLLRFVRRRSLAA
ncbi:MAG: hypothetical protein CTY29_01905 [Methylobacter sp.]|nr:MAG: hypothetical protein CTY29_01905 [Methylobacter sp.]